jgi:hypothetical protein
MRDFYRLIVNVDSIDASQEYFSSCAKREMKRAVFCLKARSAF